MYIDLPTTIKKIKNIQTYIYKACQYYCLDSNNVVITVLKY